MTFSGKLLWSTLSVLTLLAASPAEAKKKAASSKQLMADVEQGKDLYATIDTTLGTIVVKLWSKQAPKTVGNFVGLALGVKPPTDPGTGTNPPGHPFYDGLIFHRVIPGFMIQGGDPQGTGMGNPGYQFADENQIPLDRAGLLAMANAGPNTNGSQFFITEVPVARLTAYNAFGEVLSGQEVVVKITHTPRGQADRPNTPVVINKVTISETPPKS
jgi:peptidyl-prolyl cis-trans isomerase A (cyclophilin A)